MAAPSSPPIGLVLTAASRVVSRAFDDALQRAGGSLPVWLILLNLTIGKATNQRELAAAVGVREATLTHHLNAMENDGLLTRRRHPANRRVHVVELTDTGRALFLSLRDVAFAFDAQLRSGISDEEAGRLADLLERMAANAQEEML